MHERLNWNELSNIPETGCFYLYQCQAVRSPAKLWSWDQVWTWNTCAHAQLCLTLCDPMDCSQSGCMELSRQRYWRGLPFPTPGDLPDPGIEPGSPALQADSLPTELQGKLKTLSKNCRGRNTSKLILWGHHHPDTKTRQRQHTKKKTSGQYHWWT